jgi:type IV secretory pathway VirB10-like protein
VHPRTLATHVCSHTCIPELLPTHVHSDTYASNLSHLFIVKTHVVSPKDPLILGVPTIEHDYVTASGARLLPPPPPPPPMAPMASNKSAGAPPPIAPHQPLEPPPPHLQKAGGRPSPKTPPRAKAAPIAKEEEEQEQAQADPYSGEALQGAISDAAKEEPAEEAVGSLAAAAEPPPGAPATEAREEPSVADLEATLPPSATCVPMYQGTRVVLLMSCNMCGGVLCAHDQLTSLAGAHVGNNT